MPLGEFKKVLLTKDQEYNLVIRSQGVCLCKGDTSIDCDACIARSEIIEANLRWLLVLCTEHVRKFKQFRLTAEEFMADAIQGFSNAIMEFDPNKSERLITYSKKPIISALLASDLTAGIIVIPTWVRQLKRRIAKLVKEARNKGKELSLKEIAKEVKQSETTVKNALNTVECNLSIDHCDFDSSREESVCVSELSNVSGTDRSEFSLDVICEDSEEWIYESDLKLLLNKLSTDQRNVLSAKLGIGQEKMTLTQIKQVYGFGRRVSDRLYNEALTKLRKLAGVE